MGPATNVFKSRADKSPIDDFFSEGPVIRRKQEIKGPQQAEYYQKTIIGQEQQSLNKKKDKILTK